MLLLGELAGHYLEKLGRLRFLLLVFVLFASKVAAQELEWVYTTKSVSEISSSVTSAMVNDAQGNLYISGSFTNKTEFGDTGPSRIFDPTTNANNLFVMKLDSQKQIKWIRHITSEGIGYTHLSGLFISLDNAGNVIVSGRVQTAQGNPDIMLNPGNSTLFPSIATGESGIVLKFDANGNYLFSKLIPAVSLDGAVVDSANNIIVACSSNFLSSTGGIHIVYKTQIIKLAPNLNIVAEKVLDGVHNRIVSSASSSTNSNALLCDAQDNLILKALYWQEMVFRGTTYSAPGWSNIFCKFNFSQELWIKEFKENDIRLFMTDQGNNIYLRLRYKASPIIYDNQPLAVPALDEFGDELLLKLNTQGNIVWKLPVFGGEHGVTSMTQNSFGEILAVTGAEGLTYIKDQNSIVHEDARACLLVKINSQGDLTSSKTIPYWSYKILVDKNTDDILVGGGFSGTVDFNPDPVMEEIRETADENENLAFVMKLTNCDVLPPNGDPNQAFCVSQNPTVQSLEPKGFTIRWYDSASSTTPLSKTTPLVDGQTYYAAKIKVDNCPEIMTRFAVLVAVTAAPAAPEVSALQPCFNSHLRLSDLNIQGQNLKFYDSASSPAVLPATTYVIADTIYYVSQTVNGCQSPLAAVSVSSQTIVNVKNHYFRICDNDNDNLEIIDLSDYNNFIVPGYSAQTHTISYHKTFADADTNSNPILEFRNYTTSASTIYVRVSNVYSCHKVAQIAVSFSKPPEITKIDVKDFGDNNSITVLPNQSDLEYSLDGQNFQSGNYFDNLGGGEYTVFVKGTSGLCDAVSKKVFVLSYPKFFTPNGDGANDHWKIPLAIFQTAVNVEIFDRYGQLVSKFDKNSQGWDGKLNGNPLPATDYWFRIIRVTGSETVHVGHFSLVR